MTVKRPKRGKYGPRKRGVNKGGRPRLQPGKKARGLNISLPDDQFRLIKKEAKEKEIAVSTFIQLAIDFFLNYSTWMGKPK